MNGTVLIDTNILVYSLFENSIHHQKIKGFLEKKMATENFVLSIQNLTEFYAVMTNNKIANPVVPPMELVNKIKEVLSNGRYQLIFPLKQTPETIFTLLEKYPAKGQEIYDLYLAATTIDNGINTIYTADPKIFLKLGLKAINPLK